MEPFQDMGNDSPVYVTKIALMPKYGKKAFMNILTMDDGGLPIL